MIQMDSKIYIIAASFAAITLVVEGGSEFRIADWSVQANPVFSYLSSGSAIAKPKVTPKKVVYRPPVYIPPKGIGAPGGRVGAGSRGQESLTLFALVPDHLGLTIDAQPTLYWYISQPAPLPLILTINAEKQVKPVLEIVLQTSPNAGIHSVPLKDFDILLEVDTEYQWFVSLDLDGNSQSKDLVAGGRIKRILPGEELQHKLKFAVPEHITAIYSEEGLWYDALASISNLCQASPKGNHYCIGRRELLEQIDLSLDLMEIAKTEEDVPVP